MTHPSRQDATELLRCCELRTGRRSGPGGQHRNKVETAVVITHAPSGFRGEASERRSQAANRRMALFRLRLKLALELRSEDAPAEPSDLWRSRCRKGRLSVNPTHDDFPALLAEALDVVHLAGQDVKAAAESLGCSTSQLVKFLQLEPRAWQQVKAARGSV